LKTPENRPTAGLRVQVRKKRRNIPLRFLLHGLTTLDAFRKKGVLYGARYLLAPFP
jgi:hypothetical protein